MGPGRQWAPRVYRGGNAADGPAGTMEIRAEGELWSGGGILSRCVLDPGAGPVDGDGPAVSPAVARPPRPDSTSSGNESCPVFLHLVRHPDHRHRGLVRRERRRAVAARPV